MLPGAVRLPGQRHPVHVNAVRITDVLRPRIFVSGTRRGLCLPSCCDTVWIRAQRCARKAVRRQAQASALHVGLLRSCAHSPAQFPSIVSILSLDIPVDFVQMHCHAATAAQKGRTTSERERPRRSIRSDSARDDATRTRQTPPPPSRSAVLTSPPHIFHAHPRSSRLTCCPRYLLPAVNSP